MLTNTFLISLYKTIWGTIPAIGVALLIHEGRSLWLNRIVQTLSYMPHFLSYVIIYGIAIAFLSETSGLVNRWVVEAGGNGIPFLTSTAYFRSVLVGTDVWKDLGWGLSFIWQPCPALMLRFMKQPASTAREGFAGSGM